VTICPCCGFKFNGALIDGCKQCGARAVGVALPKPRRELPSYGRSLALVIFGVLTTLVFLVQTILAMFQRGAKSFGFWSWIAAAETASWRLKWIAIPVSFATLWLGRKLYRSIKRQPERFCGLRYARRGLLASAVVSLLIALLIGITVPARLRQRRMSIDAAQSVQALTLDRALYAYQLRFKTLPDKTTIKRELARLPDPDGSIAAVLREFDSAGYQPRVDVAENAAQKPVFRGVALRRASLSAATDDATPAALSFTNYDLRLPGEDKILGNEDDWIARDGVIRRVSEDAKGGLGQTAGTLRP